MLRLYSGLFVDYAFIDEALIGRESGLGPRRVYEILKSLSHNRIAHYIPRKKIPHISFSTNRIDKTKVVIPEEVYEKRKEQYSKRIHAVIDFLEKDDTCRNKSLLSYFGETVKEDCGQCDVCLRKSNQTLYHRTPEETKQLVLKQIKEAGEIMPFSLDYKEIERKVASGILQELMNEGEISRTDVGKVYLTKKGLKKYFGE